MDDELGAKLAEFLTAARSPWPQVELEDAALLAFLAARLDADPLTLSGIRPDDLCIACGCAKGNAAAVAAFRDRYLPRVRAALTRIDSPAFADEVCQHVLERLLVAKAGKPPEIEKYAGRGKLGAWVQVMAVRDGMRIKKKRQREQPTEVDQLVDRAIEVEDPELHALKRIYRKQFKQAFQDAFERLSPRDRNVLRYEYIEGLNIDQIGVLYDVHRATIARWRAAARTSLFRETKKIFEDDLKTNAQEFESIMRLIESQLDVSLPRLLHDEVAEE